MARFLTDDDIDDMVIELVGRTREEYGITVGMRGERACQTLGIRLVKSADLGNRDGAYDPGTQVVMINPDRSKWDARLQFTIYHEVMHHLLEDDGELLECFHDMLISESADAFERAKENACNLGAAEFLAPRTAVEGAIANIGLNVAVIEHVAGTLGTGLVASAIRVGHCATIDCYVVICEKGSSTRLPHNRPVLRVEYASWPRQTKYPLARYSPIQDDHIFYHTWEHGGTLMDDTYVPFPSTLDKSKFRKECRGEAKRIGNRVLGLLKLGHEVPKNQMRLGI